MIAGSRMVFASVMMASSALHLGAMTLIYSKPLVEMEGDEPMAEASLGSSFADLAQGIQRMTEPVQEVSQPVQPPAVRPVETSSIARPRVVARFAVQPVVKPEIPRLSATATPVIKAVRPIETVEKQPEPATPLQPGRGATDKNIPVVPETTVAALPEAITAPSESIRPKVRIKLSEPQKAKPAPPPAKPKGNADRNAKAGTQNGEAAKPNPQQEGKTLQRKGQGNAAASNYPGQVMARISRVPRPRTSVRGVAVVQFSITANGRLGSAGIARSSGSDALDRAALEVVRKAQPFPPPPVGARRTYFIKIKGQ